MDGGKTLLTNNREAQLLQLVTMLPPEELGALAQRLTNPEKYTGQDFIDQDVGGQRGTVPLQMRTLPQDVYRNTKNA